MARVPGSMFVAHFISVFQALFNQESHIPFKSVWQQHKKQELQLTSWLQKKWLIKKGQNKI